MAAKQHFLAFDLGAESGRGILGAFDGERLTLEEVGRFATGRGQDDLGPDGVRRWDIGRIGGEIEGLLGARAGAGGDAARGRRGHLGGGLRAAGRPGGAARSAGPLPRRAPPARHDGRSFPHPAGGDLGQNGRPVPALQHPVSAPRPPSAKPWDCWDRAAHLLLMPDLFHHQLTGGRSVANERTEASTTQFFNPTTRAWEPSLLARWACRPTSWARSSRRGHGSAKLGAAFLSMRPVRTTRPPPSPPRPPRRGRAGHSFRPAPGLSWASSCPRRT